MTGHCCKNIRYLKVQVDYQRPEQLSESPSVVGDVPPVNHTHQIVIVVAMQLEGTKVMIKCDTFCPPYIKVVRENLHMVKV